MSKKPETTTPETVIEQTTTPETVIEQTTTSETVIEQTTTSEAPEMNAAEAARAEREKELEARQAELKAMMDDLKKMKAEFENQTAAAETPAQAEEERVTIIVPRNNLADKSAAVVGVNGTMYSIPKGVPHQVPRSVAEEIARGLSAMDKKDHKIAELLSNQNIKEIV